MRNKLVLTLLATTLVGISGCETRTDGTETGGVILLVSDFDGVPSGALVNCLTGERLIGLCPDDDTYGTFRLTIDEITLENIVADPTGTSSRLMDVELVRYQIGFQRVDTGTRVPPTQFRTIGALVPVNGTATISNLPVLTSEGFTNPPLNDLRLLFGGVDSETGSETVLIDFEIVFFGRTLSGDEVQTSPFTFTVEFFA